MPSHSVDVGSAPNHGEYRQAQTPPSPDAKPRPADQSPAIGQQRSVRFAPNAAAPADQRHEPHNADERLPLLGDSGAALLRPADDRNDVASPPPCTPVSPSAAAAAAPSNTIIHLDECYGYALLALSSVAFSAMTSIVHALSTKAGPFHIPILLIVWVRSIMQFAAAALYITLWVDYHPLLANMSSDLLRLLVIRGVVGALGVISLFAALARLPLGDAITLFFMGPMFTMIGTHLTLGESVTLVEIVAGVLSFIGVALVANAASPDAAAQSSSSLYGERPVGVFFAVSAALLSAASYTLVRKMHKSVHYMFSVFSLGLASTVMTTFAIGKAELSALNGLWRRPWALALIFAQGCAAFAGQAALNSGLQHCRGVGVLIRNIDVPLAYVAGLVFLGEAPTLQSSFGAALVFLPVLGLAVRQAMQQHQASQACNTASKETYSQTYGGCQPSHSKAAAR